MSVAAKHKFNDNAKGIIWAVIAVALFSMIYLSGKITGGEIVAFQIMFLRYFGGLSTSLILLNMSNLSLKDCRRDKIYMHFLRAAAGGGSGVAAIYAAANMRIVDATAIGLLDGILTVILAVIFLKERISVPQFMSAIMCLVGAALVLFNKGELVQFKFSIPALVAFCGAILVAAEGILIKIISKTEKIIILFYVNLFGSFIFIIPSIFYWIDVKITYLLFFLSLGPLSVVAQTCNIIAFRFADASIIGSVRYSWIIFSTIVGYYIFNEPINNYTLIGISIIIFGGIGLAFSKSKMDASINTNIHKN